MSQMYRSKSNGRLYEYFPSRGGFFKETPHCMKDVGSGASHTVFSWNDFKEFEPRTFNVPGVKLIGKTELIEEAFDELNDEFGFDYEVGLGQDDGYYSAEELAEYAGRICYVSQRKELQRPITDGLTRNQTYLNHIKETKHGSVTEHAVFNFLLWDVSRNLTHELVRHRVGVAYSQLSTRYVDQFTQKYFGDTGHSIGTYFPPEVLDNPFLLEEWRTVLNAQIKAYYRAYHNFVSVLGYEKKRARSVARHILGGNSGTMLVFSVNARELNHIFDMRGSLFADDEIRRLTIAIYKEIDAGNRALFNHWELKRTEDGREYLAVRVLEKGTG